MCFFVFLAHPWKASEKKSLDFECFANWSYKMYAFSSISALLTSPDLPHSQNKRGGIYKNWQHRYCNFVFVFGLCPWVALSLRNPAEIHVCSHANMHINLHTYTRTCKCIKHANNWLVSYVVLGSLSVYKKPLIQAEKSKWALATTILYTYIRIHI